jgi:hypothetical protein
VARCLYITDKKLANHGAPAAKEGVIQNTNNDAFAFGN